MLVSKRMVAVVLLMFLDCRDTRLVSGSNCWMSWVSPPLHQDLVLFTFQHIFDVKGRLFRYDHLRQFGLVKRTIHRTICHVLLTLCLLRRLWRNSNISYRRWTMTLPLSSQRFHVVSRKFGIFNTFIFGVFSFRVSGKILMEADR
jgi:hypothetical protein